MVYYICYFGGTRTGFFDFNSFLEALNEDLNYGECINGPYVTGYRVGGIK